MPVPLPPRANGPTPSHDVITFAAVLIYLMVYGWFYFITGCVGCFMALDAQGISTYEPRWVRERATGSNPDHDRSISLTCSGSLSSSLYNVRAPLPVTARCARPIAG